MFKICPVSLQPKRPRFGSRKLLGSLAGAGIVPAAVVFALSIASGRSIGATAATFQALASNPSNLVGALYVLPPGQNAATSQPNGVVHLSWNASLTISPDPISYLVFRRPAATGSYTQIGSAAAGVLTYNDTPSTDGQYDYIIQAQVSTFTSLNSNTQTAYSDRVAPSTSAGLSGTSGTNSWYTGAVSVTLTGSDATSGVATTYYAVDNSACSSSNTAACSTYSAPFNVSADGSHTVYFFSKDSAGNAESQETSAFKIDATAPSTSASLSGTSGSNGWYTGAVSVTLSGSDATSGLATTYYAVDNSACSSSNLAACSTYSVPFSVSADGNHTVYFFSKDNAGNGESQKTSAFKIDATAPSTTATLSGTAGSNGWYTGTVSVTLNGTDASSGVATTYYAIDNSACSSANLAACSTYSAAFNVTGDANHTVYFFSKDSAGNAESQKSQAVKIDGTAPSTSSSLSGTLGSNSWYTTAVAVTLTGSDATSGVATTYYAVDNSACSAASLASCSTYSSAVSVSADGNHTIYFFSKDTAGNAESQKSTAFKIDATAPGPTTKSVSGGTTGTNSWYTATPSITLSSSDATSGLASKSYQFVSHGSAAPSNSGGGWTTYSAAFGIPVGDDDLYAYSTDSAGNKETPVNLGEFKLDSTAPATTASLSGTAGTNSWYTSSVTVTLSGTDATSGIATTYYQVDGSSSTCTSGNTSGCTTYAAPFSVSADGNHTVYFFSKDNAGNAESQKTQTVKVDATAPTTSVSLSGTVGNNSWYTTSVSVTLTATDATSGVGTTYYAVDNSACSSSNTAACSTYSAPFSVSTDGSRTVYFFSTDSAGNGESQKTSAFKIDATLPTVSAVAVCDQSGLVLPVTANWVGSSTNYIVYANVSDSTSGIASVSAATGAAGGAAGASFTLSASSGTCAGTTYSYKSASQAAGALGAGANSRFINVSATDNAGNVKQSDAAGTGNLGVDNTAPPAPGSITGTTGAAGSGQITFGWTAPVDAGGAGLAGYSATVADHSTGAVVATPTFSAGTTSYVFTGTSGTHYTFSIQAIDNAGNNGAAGSPSPNNIKAG